MKPILTLLVMVFLWPLGAMAEATYRVADARVSAPPRFMPLAGVREGGQVMHVLAPNSGAPVLKPIAAASGGFMPLDRTKMNALAPSRGLSLAAPAASPPRAESIEPMRVVNEVEKQVSAAATLRTAKQSPSSKLTHAWPLPLKTPQDFTSAFGMRRDPFTGDPRFHEGIDISARPGTPVLASADGVVDKVTTGRDYGKYVVVTHRDNSQTIYGHLSKQSVEEGERIQQGQKLGEVGSTGRSTGPHLHFQVEHGGKAVNPLAHVRLPSQVNRTVAMK